MLGRGKMLFHSPTGGFDSGLSPSSPRFLGEVGWGGEGCVIPIAGERAGGKQHSYPIYSTNILSNQAVYASVVVPILGVKSRAVKDLDSRAVTDGMLGAIILPRHILLSPMQKSPLIS
jgi:hypothetical protein